MARTENISWEAEEYIIRNRNTWWYVGLIVVSLALCVLSFFLKWWTFLALIVLIDITLLTSSLRPPRKIKYTLTNDSLEEGNNKHNFADYKAFGILREDNHYSVILIPKKRFSLSTKVYFPSSNGETIVDWLGARLPMEEIKLDFLDKIVNFLRI